MSVLLPLLAAAPAVTGLAGYYARDIRGPQTLPAAPPTPVNVPRVRAPPLSIRSGQGS